MPSESSYIKEVTNLILERNEMGITEVKDVEYLKGLNFVKEEYHTIIETIKEKTIEDIKELPEVNPKTFEDLTILKFHDQNDRLYIVTIYDNDEMWQDPEILNIFLKY